jgi:hypothetical protein
MTKRSSERKKQKKLIPPHNQCLGREKKGKKSTHTLKKKKYSK